MSECYIDGATQVLSGRVGNHNRDNFGKDLEGNGIFFFLFYVFKRSVYRSLEVLVAEQCGKSKACLGQSELVHVFEARHDLFIRVKRLPGYVPVPAAVVQSVLR